MPSLPFLLDFGVRHTSLPAYFNSTLVILGVLVVIQFRKRDDSTTKFARRLGAALMMVAVAAVYATLMAQPSIMDLNTGVGILLISLIVDVAIVASFSFIGTVRKKLWVQAPLYGVVAMLSLGLVSVLLHKAALMTGSYTWLSDVLVACTYVACVFTYLAIIGAAASFVWRIVKLVKARQSSAAAGTP